MLAASRQRLAALGVGAAAASLLLAAVLFVGRGGGGSALLSGADAQAAQLVQRRGAALRRGVGEGGSQLADLIDSPLMLAKQKIDNYLSEDSDNLVEAARKMNVVGSKQGGAPCTSLKCDNGVWQNDYLQTSEDRMEKVSPRAACAFLLSLSSVSPRARVGRTRPQRPACEPGQPCACPYALPPCALHSRVPSPCLARGVQVLNGEDPGKKPLTSAEKNSFLGAENDFAVSCSRRARCPARLCSAHGVCW